jgi:hypothetical protein
MLILYFTLAVGFHTKAAEKRVFGGMAAGLMILFVAMPAQRRRPPTPLVDAGSRPHWLNPA